MNKQLYHQNIESEVFRNRNKMSDRFFIRHFNSQSECVLYIRKMQYFYDKSKIKKVLAMLLKKKLVNKYGLCVEPTAIIGTGLHIPHPTGIVIGSSVVIGNNCSIYQNVTIGGARIGDSKNANHPKIGDNVTIFAGSMILGNITVADNVVVAANSVLLTDATVPGLYAGTPAKLVKSWEYKDDVEEK